MDNKTLKMTILIILIKSIDQQLASKEVYKEIIKHRNISPNQLKEVYTDKKGKISSKFETRVRGAVEDLRRESVLVRGGERGVWVLA